VTVVRHFWEVFAARVRKVADRFAVSGVWNMVRRPDPRPGASLPFTPCLDVSLRVTSVASAPQAAFRLQADFVELARDPHRWPFRHLHAETREGDLVVRALLLEPLEELYGADVASDGAEAAATDVVLALLNANCPAWRALEVGAQRVSADARRVHRRIWTEPPA
jgi:hypothetical protein